MAATKTSWFRRERPALSQESDSALHIWWGPIRTEKQAREIVAWTAWSLLLIGLAPMVALSMSAASGQITLARPFWENREDNWLVLGQAAFLTVESAAAILLITRRTWIAALALLGCCLAGVLALLASIVRLGGDGGLDLAKLSQLAVLELCLLCFTRLVWRAFAATRALPRLALAGNFT
jgi:hypothetical protein